MSIASALFCVQPLASAHCNLGFWNFFLRYLEATKSSKILKATTKPPNLVMVSFLSLLMRYTSVLGA